MSDFEVRYTRQKPEEWDVLLDTIDPDAEMQRPVSVEEAQHAMRAAGSLETERLESTAYYAWGLGICGIARALHNPEQRATVATTIADELSRDNLRMRTFIENPGPRAFNALTIASFQPLRELGVQTYAALPAREHLAADALTIATRARRGGFDMFTFKGQPALERTHYVQKGRPAAEIIVSNATAGSVIAHAHQRAALAAATNPAANQNLTRFAVQSAALHTEEFQGPLYKELVTYAPDGSVRLDRDKLPDEPQLPEHRLTDIKHLGRLGCPAIQVQFAIPGMLELMLDIERVQEVA